MLEIEKILTLSTGHITSNTAKKLDLNPATNCLGLCVYHKASYGWYIIVDENAIELATNNKLPRELANLILFTRDVNCSILCLDQDGYKLPYLKSFNW